MVKKKVKDPLFLAQKSVDATEGPFGGQFYVLVS